MTIVRGIDEAGEVAFYDLPGDVLQKHKVKAAHLTEEIQEKLFPGKKKLTKDDADGVIPATSGKPGDVAGFAAWCVYWLVDAYGNYVWWEDYC